MAYTLVNKNSRWTNDIDVCSPSKGHLVGVISSFAMQDSAKPLGDESLLTRQQRNMHSFTLVTYLASVPLMERYYIFSAVLLQGRA